MILHPGNLEDLNNVQSGVYGAKSQIQINQMNMFRAFFTQFYHGPAERTPPKRDKGGAWWVRVSVVHPL